MAQYIAEGLWRLDIPLPGSPLKNLNSYLFTGARNLLVDTGFCRPACRAAMESQLSRLGVDLGRTDLLVTHLHTDHTGLTTLLHRPGCRVYLSAADRARLLTYRTDAPWQAMWAEYEREGFARWEMDALWGTNPARNDGPPLLEEYDVLGEGDELSYGEWRLRCLLTPGHTPGHLCLYDAGRRTVVTGDHVLYHITPNICRWGGVADSLGDYLASLEKIRALAADTVLPAHRTAEGSLERRVDELTAHHRRRLADARRTLLSAPGLTAYEIAGRMAWEIRCRTWADFPLTQKFFAVGEALAHLDYLRARGQAVCREENGQRRWYAAGGKGFSDTIS